MRVNVSSSDLSVRCIAGTEVILFGLNVPDDKADGLLGFKIEKRHGADWIPLNDRRKFPNSSISLVQRFMWSDYSVNPKNSYTYRFAAAYGSPDNLRFSTPISLDVRTEDPDHGKHAVYFNRGVAGSQAYARKFGEHRKRYKDDPTEQDPSKIEYTDYLKPADVPEKEAYEWLSRGLEEALLKFIAQAKGDSYKIRASLYELSHVPAAQAFVDALESGVDVEIIHHAKTQTVYKRYSNRNAVTQTMVFEDDHSIQRQGGDTTEFDEKETPKRKFKVETEINKEQVAYQVTKKDSSRSRYQDEDKTYVIKSEEDVVTSKIAFTYSSSRGDAEDTIIQMDSTASTKEADIEVYKGSEIVKLRVPDDISETAMRTMGSIGIKNLDRWEAFTKILKPRTNANISHNKFIILLKDDKPVQVWTGSTNLTGGGIYGQSNVGQIIRDEEIAGQYFQYWNKLKEDPEKSSKGGEVGMRDWLAANNPDLQGPVPENSVQVIMSPRQTEHMLQWYADRLDEAKDSVFLTLAFSIDERFSKVVKADSAHANNPSFLRYLLLEDRYAQYIKPHFDEMTGCEQNQVAWGDKLRRRRGVESEDLIEALTGLNNHVNYVHTKYMIVDALTDDPLVISGSANFSSASTTDNDENMLIIRGNTRIADIYLTEFMRLFNHFEGRNLTNALSDEDFEKEEELDPTSAWKDRYFEEGSPYQRERLLFATRPFITD